MMWGKRSAAHVSCDAAAGVTCMLYEAVVLIPALCVPEERHTSR